MDVLDNIVKAVNEEVRVKPVERNIIGPMSPLKPPIVLGNTGSIDMGNSANPRTPLM
jgi:hypothetical protein